MTTKTSPDDLLKALGSIKPDADGVTNAWYIGRREQTLQTVLTRATQEPQTDAATSPRPASVAPALAGAAVASKWRHHRRALMAGVAGLAMVGGGAAWAYTNYVLGDSPGGNDGLTCMTSWAAPGDRSHADEQYGGATLSTDPIADCARYAEMSGKPTIVDPVAVSWGEFPLVVGPRAGMPADATPLEAPPDPHVFELESSLADHVDGGMSQCFDATTGMQFAQAELDRLGLTDWTVTTSEQADRSRSCAFLFVAGPGTVEVRTSFRAPSPDVSSGLIQLLRDKVAGPCLSLSEAETVVADAAPADPVATATQVDPTAACTRVDLVIGGDLQVFLYGPATAKR